MILIGIDPGTLIAGYGVVEKKGSHVLHIDNGCLVGTKKADVATRLFEIYNQLLVILETFKPQSLALEKAFFGKNIQSTLRLGEARGVILLAAMQKGIAIVEYSTREVKQAITGYGQASKEQVQEMVKRLLKLPEVAQVDASDALALALCHGNSIRATACL